MVLAEVHDPFICDRGNLQKNGVQPEDDSSPITKHKKTKQKNTRGVSGCISGPRPLGSGLVILADAELSAESAPTR